MTKQPSRRRLDAELVNRKVARSRDQAVEMIRSGRVMVNGFQATKPATRVEPGISIKVEKSVDDNWASRVPTSSLARVMLLSPRASHSRDVGY